MERIIIAASAIAVAGLVLTALSAAAWGSAKAAAKWPSAEQPRLGAATARIGLILGVVLCGAAAGLAAWLVPVDIIWVTVPVVAAAALITVGLVTWAAIKLASKIELSALINSPSPLAGQTQTATAVFQTQAPAAIAPRPSSDSNSEDEIAYGKPYPGMVTVGPPPGSPPDDSNTVDGVHTTTPDSAPPATQSVKVDSSSTDRVDPVIPTEALPGWVYTDEADNWYLVTAVAGGKRLLRLGDFTIAPPTSAAGQLALAGSIEMTVWPTNVEETDTEEHPVVTEDD